MNKNKKQRSYKVIETNGFSFKVRNEVKEPGTKFLLSHGHLPFWFLKP